MVFREPVLMLATLSAGLVVTVFGGLAAEDATHARAVYSIWPVLLLGGIAVARFIRLGPSMEGTGWLGWWSLGLIAYLIHLLFAFGGVYDFDPRAVIAGQGLFTAAVNVLLLVLWLLSVIAAFIPSEPPWERGLNIVTAALFIATALTSSLVFGHHPVSNALGVLLVVIWLVALWRRLGRAEAGLG
ncbi:MAG: hypothetical protein D6754_14110 [Alphaproteobacteria bacterium]|nr:MAG: hypothetical protein D6754_14110 [Alphaproteobacteria bacterium]